MDNKTQGMLVEGVFGSEAVDSSGEVLDVAGANIDDLVEGVAQINYEHQGDEQGSGTDWVGRVVYAKKIFKESDCENNRQRAFWNELQLPFIYGVARLYDAAGHESAKALAAAIRDHHANGEKILWRWSVEGSTLKTSPDKKRLLESVIRSVALTRKPCNRSAETKILSDPQAPEGFDKHPVKVEKDFLDEVLKRSERAFSLYSNLGSATVLDYNPILAEADFRKSEGSNDGPPEDESQYVRMKDWHDKFRSQYVDENGQPVTSSRTTPFTGEIPPVGTWAIDHIPMNYGREISQLRELDPHSLEPSEATGPERRADVQRYAQWAREGKQAPPITVVETDAGGMRICDGHRRWLAAKQAGTKVLGWVSPSAPHPENLVDSNGRPMKVGLTYELATGKPYKKTQKSEKGADAETKKIAENRKTAKARRPHRFQSAEWTHPNGHPRCRLCGDEETMDGMCAGADHDGLSSVPGSSKLGKTLTAGNYNAAPGTLTGGAALQREDQSMVLKAWANRAKASLRGWDGTGKFKDVLKHDLPEASDEFIDRFADMVDEHKFKKADILLGKSERSGMDRDALIRKYEALAINLRKMADQIANGTVDAPTPGQFEFQGRKVTAGLAVTGDGKSSWAVLGETPDHYIGMSVAGKVPASIDLDSLVRLPRAAEGKNYLVHQPLQTGDFIPSSTFGAQPPKPSMGLESVFDVYMTEGGKRRLAGRILKTANNVDVLADFFGHLAHAQGPIAQVQPVLDQLQQQGFMFVSRADYGKGVYPDLIREQDFASAPEYSNDANGDVNEQIMYWPRPARPSEFEYHHPALKTPIALTVKDKVLYFNGNPLKPSERDRVLQNIRNRIAKIRYKNGQQALIAKSEHVFESLMKIEPHLQSALEELRGAVKVGHVSPEALRHLTSNLFVDPMVKGVGNKKAYEDFLSRPRQGVHVRLDGNDFGQINKIHSFEHGNQAITAMGGAMREAMDEAVGRQNGKLFRIGGDEFHAHVPTHEHAAQFMRSLRGKLEAIPAIGGTHNLSVSAGFGVDPNSADQASIHAKQAKKAAMYQPGQAKTHVHSLVPGHEGAIPMDREQLPTISPKAAGVTEAPQGTPPAPAAPAQVMTPKV